MSIAGDTQPRVPGFFSQSETVLSMRRGGVNITGAGPFLTTPLLNMSGSATITSNTISFGTGSLDFGPNNIVNVGGAGATNSGTSVGSGANASSSSGAVAVGRLANAQGVGGIAIGNSSIANSGNVQGSIAIGYSATAVPGAAGNTSIAIGTNSNAGTANGVVTIGHGATVGNGSTSAINIGPGTIGTNATSSIKIGTGSISNSVTNAVVIGTGSNTAGNNAVSVGTGSASSNNGIVIGTGSVSSAALSSIVIGSAAVTTNAAIAIGSSITTPPAANSVSIGTSSNASGATSVALGPTTTASGSNSIAIGNTVTASGSNSIAIGNNITTVLGQSAIAIGSFANAASFANVAVGNGAQAAGAECTAIGGSGLASSETTLALGNTAIGYLSVVGYTAAGGNVIYSTHSTAIGSRATVSDGFGIPIYNGEGHVAIGSRARTAPGSGMHAGVPLGSPGSVAIGGSATDANQVYASGIANVAIGYGSRSNAANAISYARTSIGFRAICDFDGQVNLSNGRFNEAADMATGLIPLFMTTTTTGAVEMGTSQGVASTTPAGRIACTNFSTYIFDVDIVARAVGSTGVAAYNLKFAANRDNGAGTFTISSVSKNVLYTIGTTTGWDVGVTADTTNGRPNISVTGAAATTIRWVGHAKMTKVATAS